jgi:hypothetical protein
MEKKIKVTAQFDMQEFDRDLNRMKDKLKEMYAPSNEARMRSSNAQRLEGLGFSAPGSSSQAKQAFSRASQQDMNELDKYIRKESQHQDKIVQALDNRTKKLKELRKEYEQIVKLGQDDLKLKEDIAKTESSMSRLREVSQQKNVNIAAALDARDQVQANMPHRQRREQQRLHGMERLATAYRHGGITGMGKAGFRMMAANPLGAAAGATALVGAGINLAVPIMRQEDTAERRTFAAQGSAVRNAGYMQENVMQGQGQTNMYWMQENNRAMQKAIKEMDEQRKTDNWKVGGAGAAVAGGLGMAATGVGALPGLALSLGGAAYAGYNFISDENMRNKMLGGLGFNSRRQRYESGLVETAMKNYKQNLESEKSINSFKRMGEKYYNRTGLRNLRAQRTLGINDNQMYGEGGFLGSSLGQGFTEEQALQEMNNIISSGGSTRMARNPQEALKFIRNTSLTNAGSVMGRLSGTLGDSASTEQATIKILAEGMRQGLNGSEFAEEQRKFSQTVAQMVFRSGTETEQGAADIAKSFGSYLEDTTTRGIQGAQGAYQIQQGLSSTSGGIRGAIQAASIMNNKKLGNMTFDQRMSFMDLSEEDINAGGAEVESMAEASELSLEDFKKEAIKVKRNAVGLRNSTDAYKKQYQEAVKTGDKKAARNIMGKYISALSAEDKTFKGKGRSEREAFARSNLSGEQGVVDTTSVTNQLKSGTGRMGDDTEKATARSQQIALEEFNKVKDDLQEAAKSASTMSSAMMEALLEMSAAIKDEGTESVKRFGEALKLYASEIEKERQKAQTRSLYKQPTGGKGK